MKAAAVSSLARQSDSSGRQRDSSHAESRRLIEATPKDDLELIRRRVAERDQAKAVNS
jgi:hypothetical protein